MFTSIAFVLTLTITLATAIAALPTVSSPSQSPNRPSPLSVILSHLGFRDLAAVAATANIYVSVPTTVFALTDSSLRTCPSCSLSLLLQEHSLRGLYSFHYMRTLAFGTKIETYAANRCLTITASSAASPIVTPTPATAPKVFINGIEITKPDLFNNGLIIVHALRGFVSHLSPISCHIEFMKSLSFSLHPPTAMFFSRRIMLKDAMTQLRSTGYTIVALAMRVQYTELADLDTMTLFTVDDESIFRDEINSRDYVAEIGYHVVPNMLLRASDLIRLPMGTSLPTMIPSRNLTVTTADGGGPLERMTINHVTVKRFDYVYNLRIVVHVLPKPFSRYSSSQTKIATVG